MRIQALGVEKLLDLAVAWAGGEIQRTILYVNAHILNLACVDEEYRCVLNAADLVYPDGIGAVWGGRWLAKVRMQKVTGADWIDPFCSRVREQQQRLYILAGRPGIALAAADRLERRWPGLQIVGLADGYFLEKPEAEVLGEIQRCRPHYLLAGMGSPLQEKWLRAHRAEIPAPVCWAVGALFDFVAGAEPRAPAWMNQVPLEWLWRLYIDPKGKWKRYLIGNPLFLLRLLRQRIKGRQA